MSDKDHHYSVLEVCKESVNWVKDSVRGNKR